MKDKWRWWRPTKFTPECIRKLQEIFMVDWTVKEACLSAGVSEVQYYEHLKVDEEFAKQMKYAQMYAYITAKKTLIKSMKSENESVAQKGAIEFLKRRDKRYADKVENSVELDGKLDAEIKLEDKSMKELEQLRKEILG